MLSLKNEIQIKIDKRMIEKFIQAINMTVCIMTVDKVTILITFFSLKFIGNIFYLK